MLEWYFLQTKPREHMKACENLKRQGFGVFLPLILKTVKKNGKFIDSEVPLFPGYLFMSTTTDPVPWKSINATRGISKAATLDGIYRPINNSIVEGIKHRCDENSIIQNIDKIVPGNRIKIERGPFADFICTVDEIADSRRAWVFIELLNQQTKTEVSLSNVSKIN